MCGVTGALIPSETVAYQVKEDVKEIVWPREIFSLCMDESCEMAYYSADYGYLFLQRDIKAALDHKLDTKDRYICYCQAITYDQVTRAVKQDGIKTAKAFFKFRKPIILERCKVENPFGCSCLPDIQKHMDETLKEL